MTPIVAECMFNEPLMLQVNSQYLPLICSIYFKSDKFVMGEKIKDITRESKCNDSTPLIRA